MMRFLVPCLSAFFGSLGFVYVFNIRGMKAFISALGGAMGWVIYLALEGCFETDIPQYFFACIAISIYAEVFARVCKTPAAGFLAIAFIPLVPGSGIYHTMEYGIGGQTDLFLVSLLHTMGIACALALAVILVSSATRLLTNMKRFQQLQKDLMLNNPFRRP